MKKTILSILVLAVLSFTGFADSQSKADSLLKLIRDSKKVDTTKISLMLEYSYCFFPTNPDSMESINKRIIQASEKIGYPYGIIRGMNGMAMSKWIRNDLTGARDIFLKALAKAEANKIVAMQVMVGDNLGLLYHNQGALDSAEYFYLRAIEAGKGHRNIKYYPKTLSDLAMNYNSKANYIEAIHYQMEAKKQNAVARDKKNEVVICIGLGNIFMGFRDFDKAISAYWEAKRLNDSLKDINFQIAVFQNIGLLYVDIKPRADSARYFLGTAKELALKNNKQGDYFTCLVNLGLVELKEKKYMLALDYFQKAYESPVFNRKNYERAAVLVNLGAVHVETGDYTKAEKFAREGVELAHAGGYRDFESAGLTVLAQAAAGKNDYKKAYYFQLQTDTLRDSIWSETVKNRITEATYNFALKQAESENDLLLKDNEIKKQTIYNQWFIVGGIIMILLLLIILTVVLFRTSRKQKSLNRILDQKNIQLEELNLTKDKFISIIAHDLKSPFNSLLGLLTELDENYQDYNEKTKHDIIHNLKQSSFNAFNLLVNLLEWSQSQKGKLTSSLAEFHLKTVVDEVFAVLSTRAVLKQQKLVADIIENLIVYSDPQIIKSILLNLVNNSIKFTASGGQITVSAIAGNEGFNISVTDTGIGIPSDKISNLFRLDSGFKRKGTEEEPGTGLGLVMCHEYVDLVGGEIQVSSEEGKGSTFTLLLPKQAG